MVSWRAQDRVAPLAGLRKITPNGHGIRSEGEMARKVKKQAVRRHKQEKAHLACLQSECFGRLHSARVSVAIHSPWDLV
jgi:hypothetical protein